MGESPKQVWERLLVDPVFEAWLRELLSSIGSIMARVEEVDVEALLRAPQTALRQFKQELTSDLALPEINHAQVRLLRLLWAAILNFDDTVEHLAAAFRSSASNLATQHDAASSAILKLAAEADASIPYVARLAFAPRPNDFDVRVTECAASLAKAERMEGEERARQVMEAFRMMAETIYPRYLLTLLRLTALRHGKWTKATGSIGNLAGSTPPAVLVDFSQLLEKDAAFFRNASAHQNWEYLDDDKLKVWNEDPPGTMKRGPEEFAVGELLDRARSMFQHSHKAVDSAAVVYGLRMGAELLEKTLPLWVELFTGHERLEALEEATREAKILLQASEDFAKKHGIVPAGSPSVVSAG